MDRHWPFYARLESIMRANGRPSVLRNLSKLRKGVSPVCDVVLLSRLPRPLVRLVLIESLHQLVPGAVPNVGAAAATTPSPSSSASSPSPPPLHHRRLLVHPHPRAHTGGVHTIVESHRWIEGHGILGYSILRLHRDQVSNVENRTQTCVRGLHRYSSHKISLVDGTHLLDVSHRWIEGQPRYSMSPRTLCTEIWHLLNWESTPRGHIFTFLRVSKAAFTQFHASASATLALVKVRGEYPIMTLVDTFLWTHDLLASTIPCIRMALVEFRKQTRPHGCIHAYCTASATETRFHFNGDGKWTDVIFGKMASRGPKIL